MTAVYALVLGLALIVFLLAMLVIGLLRSHADILRKLDSIGAGLDDQSGPSENRLSLQPATGKTQDLPSIVGVNPEGDPVAIAPAVGVNPVLIAFLSTSCSSCSVFWEQIDQAEMVFGPQRHRVLLATLGPEEESPTRAQALRRGNADVVMSSQAWEDYEVPGAPYFVVVEPGGGIIGEGSADNFDALTTFLTDSANDQQWDRRRRADRGNDRVDRIDRELRDAGIEPGDARLYHDPTEFDEH